MTLMYPLNQNRKYEVKSGIPIIFAKKRLEGRKDAVFLPVDFEYYGEISQKAMEIIKKSADVFEYVGKDEAYLDVTNRVNGSFETASFKSGVLISSH